MVLESKGRKEVGVALHPAMITHSDPLVVFMLFVPATMDSVSLEVLVIDWVVLCPILTVNRTTTT